MNWIGYAQNWLRDNAARLFGAWLQTKSGKAWKSQQYHYACVPVGFGNNRRTARYAPQSPYAFGFSLPDYQHDLIKAVGRGDEETAKSIMLFHGIGACTVGD